ncbi:MAG TPA: hypothetical protein VH186_26705 [Chloroflexia bacterium]|nr:hypothetical protein [Chloroflexia bacterium]
MALITRIDLLLNTASVPGAGTDGFVYMGIGGREFQIDAAGNDFEQGQNRLYIIGQGSNLLDAPVNDPTNPALDTNDLSKFPKYIRFEPTSGADEWILEDVSITVNPGTTTQQVFRSPVVVGSTRKLHLSQKAGKFCYLA